VKGTLQIAGAAVLARKRRGLGGKPPDTEWGFAKSVIRALVRIIRVVSALKQPPARTIRAAF